jgi:CheY-like chemotaxis protein
MLLLLVDDDPDDREIFVEALHQINPQYYCVTAKDGDEALVFLRKEAIVMPDYIFLDLNMPKMDGRQTLRELASDKSLNKIPVCIYTTSNRTKDRDVTASMGAKSYVVKASSFDDLKHSIRSVIG